MQPFPHRYQVSATADLSGDVSLESPHLPVLRSAAPVEFGGPGDRWSPETLLVAAVADCFILTFRAIAQFSKLRWLSLTCEVDGTVDRVDRVTRFTGLKVRASLQAPEGVNEEQAHRLMMRAEETCLVVASLNIKPELEADVIVQTEADVRG